MSALGRFIAANRRLCEAIDRRFPTFGRYPDSWKALEARIDASVDSGVGRVLELGGADRPMLEKNPAYEYVGLDIEEQPRCHEVYDRFLVQSVERPIDPEGTGFDLIVSKTLLEHVPDNDASFGAMHAALRPGGVMHHMIPCRNHPYSWILRAIGPRMQKRVIRWLHPANAEITGFPTFFDHCSVKDLDELLAKKGFEAVDIAPFYVATDYFRFFVPLYVVVRSFEWAAERLGLSGFAALVVLSAKRPGAQPA